LVHVEDTVRDGISTPTKACACRLRTEAVEATVTISSVVKIAPILARYSLAVSTSCVLFELRFVVCFLRLN